MNSKLSSNLLLLLIYSMPLVYLFAYFSNVHILKFGLWLILFVYALFNLLTRGLLRKKVLLVILFLFTLIGINVYLADNLEYVVSSASIVILKSSIVILIFNHSKNLLNILIRKWYKVSLLVTLLLPYYMNLVTNDYINYMDFSRILFTNIIGIVLYYIFHKKINIFTWIVLAINLSSSLFLGSRLYTLIILISIVYLLIANYYRKNKILVSLIVAALMFATGNIVKIAEWAISISDKIGIRSRNLHLLLDYLKSENETLYLAGREEIYGTVLNHILNEGLLPSGLAKVRYLTDGMYYHSHNIFLEYFLVMGLVLGLLTLSVYVIKVFKVLFCAKNRIWAHVLLALNFYFIIEGVTGSNFTENTIFWLAIGITFYKGDINEDF